MKKFISLPLVFVLLLLCGCEETQKNSSDTRFLLNTFVTLDAECDEVVLEQAFALCANYEDLLSRTKEGSDVHKINSGETVEVSKSTAEVINRALYYSDISGGKFDISICPVSDLWDFNNEVVPSRDEIAEALKNVDYQQISVDGRFVNANGAKIDLGGIAKGYIADRLTDYFKNSGTAKGLINLGGNIAVFGDYEYSIGIKDPSGKAETVGAVKVKNKSVVTSGTYERSFEKDDKFYHHILDPETGYGVESDLVSATIIGESSIDCDALATVCVLLGSKKAADLIENTEGFEAVFINTKGKITYTSGILREENEFILK